MKPSDIKKLRLRLGWTQRKLGDLLGVTDTTVRRWEMGLRNPSARCLAELEKLEKGAAA